MISTHEDYYDIRFNIRKEKLEPILDNFIEYVETEIKNALPRSPLGKALEYAKKHLPGLKNVLLYGSLETLIIMLLKELLNLLLLEERNSYL